MTCFWSPSGAAYNPEPCQKGELNVKAYFPEDDKTAVPHPKFFLVYRFLNYAGNILPDVTVKTHYPALQTHALGFVKPSDSIPVFKRNRFIEFMWEDWIKINGHPTEPLIYEHIYEPWIIRWSMIGTAEGRITVDDRKHVSHARHQPRGSIPYRCGLPNIRISAGGHPG